MMPARAKELLPRLWGIGQDGPQYIVLVSRRLWKKPQTPTNDNRHSQQAAALRIAPT